MASTPTGSRVSALFDTQAQVQSALDDLRAQGVSESHFSVVTRQSETTIDAMTPNDDTGADVTAGSLAGAGVGALFGVASALIPGVGPFVFAGTLLATALGSAAGGALTGAVVGGTTGLVGSALAKAGYDESAANSYGSAIESGSTLLVVDASDLNAAVIEQILANHGGRTAIGGAYPTS